VSESILFPPPGTAQLPEFDRGWLLEPDERSAFLTYSDDGDSVNWSPELESLHAESTRNHFIDRWTRAAILARVGHLDSGASVVDVGCSSGYLLQDLRASRPDLLLVGVDLVSSGLVKAHALVPDARLVYADARALPLLDSSVDGIVSSNLLEHVPDDLGALREFARVLRSGARAVVVVPAGPRAYDYYDRFLGHERRYARHELAEKVRVAGLEVIEDGFIASLLYPLFWLVKQRNRMVHAGLQGAELEQRVTADIARTHTSKSGLALWRLEERLGLRLPFGVRSIVVARKPL
jgi:SAM-dependent methyltransferase